MTHGGCQCRAVRYDLKTDATVIYACHCRECQRQSGSAFGLSMPVPTARLTLTGELGSWERATGSSGRTRCSFCVVCGTRIHHVSLARPDWTTIKAGTLDDTSGLIPRVHIWTRSKQAWVMLDPTVPAFETQPDDLAIWREALVEAWS